MIQVTAYSLIVVTNSTDTMNNVTCDLVNAKCVLSTLRTYNISRCPVPPFIFLCAVPPHL